jgi:hypothetical protein
MSYNIYSPFLLLNKNVWVDMKMYSMLIYAQKWISQSSPIQTFGSRMMIFFVDDVLVVVVVTVVSHSFPVCVTLTVFPENFFGTPRIIIRSTRISCIDLRYDDVNFPFVARLLETSDFPDNVNFR